MREIASAVVYPKAMGQYVKLGREREFGEGGKYSLGISYLGKQPVDSTQAVNVPFLLQIPAQEIKSRDWN